MNLIKWDNAQLEPVIITYNRAPQLEQTLLAFFNAGLSEMRLHVLDNCSTDATAQVVAAMQQQWPKLTYHKNPYNIGGAANILRALEISNSAYHWVIGDDDVWYFTPQRIHELLSVLQHQHADILRLGWLVSDASRGLLVNGKLLAQQEALFFASTSMISATIVRRSICCKYLNLSYQSISDSYPHMVAIIRAIENDSIMVYSLSKNIMQHVPSTAPGYFFGDLEWYACWFRTARVFKDNQHKKRFIHEIVYYMCQAHTPPQSPFLWLTKVLLYYKSYNVRQLEYLLTMLNYGQGWRIRMSLLILLNSLLPNKLAYFMRLIYQYWSNTAEKQLSIDRTRL